MSMGRFDRSSSCLSAETAQHRETSPKSPHLLLASLSDPFQLEALQLTLHNQTP